MDPICLMVVKKKLLVLASPRRTASSRAVYLFDLKIIQAFFASFTHLLWW